jgi:biotin carboxyl carrier protein
VALVDRQASAYELIQVTGEAARRGAGAAAGASLDAQMPGQVRQVLVKEGDHVEAGQTLLILEAMKMEMRIAAPQAGRVVRLLVRQGDTVERGEQLVEIQPLG